LPPALERRLIAFPKVSGQGIVAIQISTLEVAQNVLRLHLLVAPVPLGGGL
jgi:hypothetical protein